METPVEHPRVIAVSGLSGAGKSSVVRSAAKLLGGAPVLSFDDYAATSSYPRDMRTWLEAGADVNVYQTPRLANDLRELRNRRPVSIHNGDSIEPGDIVLIEEPLGRLRLEMAPLIDFAVFLDVPFDLLLARRLIRRLVEEREQHGEAMVGVLLDELRGYIDLGRRLHERAQDVLRDGADAVLDGTRPIDELARAILVAAGVQIADSEGAARKPA